MFKGLRFFLHYGWKYDKRYVLWLLMLQAVNAMIPLAAALLPRLVIDELTGAQRTELLALYVAAFAGYLLLSNALSAYFTKDGFTRRCRVAAQFDFELHRRLAEADYADIESPAFRDMQAKAKKFLTCDYHGFGYLLDCAMNILGQAATLCGLAALLSTLGIWFVLLFAALAAASSVIEARATRRAMDMGMEVVSTNRQWMYCAQLFEEPQWAKELRLNGIRDWLLRRERAIVGRANDCLKRQNDCFIASGIKRAGLSFVQQCAAYAFLIARVLSGGMGVGAFTMCVTAVTSFAEGLRQIMSSLSEIRAYDFYYDQLDAYLNTPRTLRSGTRRIADRAPHRFELRDVGLRYPGADAWALRHIDLTIEAGERLALVGENGSGKTTLIKLLCRLYDPTEGEILMDGIDIREYDYDEYTSQFATVFQDLRLFDFPLRDNLAFGRDMRDSDMQDALDRVGLRAFADGLPRGLDTSLGRAFDEQGVLPSGGEAQKIALARALLRDAPVILLDEPTAALDARAEYEMYRGFASLTDGRTAVYISHRMSSARFCDRVAVLNGGLLCEYGTHAELMARGGVYAGLYAMQAQYYSEGE